jgi:hypothetical protein
MERLSKLNYNLQLIFKPPKGGIRRIDLNPSNNYKELQRFVIRQIPRLAAL